MGKNISETAWSWRQRKASCCRKACWNKNQRAEQSSKYWLLPIMMKLHGVDFFFTIFIKPKLSALESWVFLHTFSTPLLSLQLSVQIKHFQAFFSLWTTNIWHFVSCFVPFPEAKAVICARAKPDLVLGLLLSFHLSYPWCVYHHIQATKSLPRMRNIVRKPMLFKSSQSMKNKSVYF